MSGYAGHTPSVHTCDSCAVTAPDVMALALTVRKRSFEMVEQIHGIGSIRLCPDCWEQTGVRCDLCHVSARKAKVRRASMVRSQKVAGKNTSRGMGSLYLCETCWRSTAAKRRQPRPQKVAA